MQTKRNKLGFGMTLLPSLESLIPEDHYLRRLDRVLDLSFVHEAVRDRYCQDNGRPSIDPEVIIRLFLIQAMDGIVHVRELMRQVQVNLAYRWFIGYSFEDKLPDHSTLSKALDRFGDDVFNTLFKCSIAQCQASGLIEGRVLHVDATTIRADIDRERVGKPDSPDPDARYGKFPGKRTAPGYKQHTVVDNQSRVVLGLSVTPANESEHNRAIDIIDDAIRHLDRNPEAVCADAAYGNGRNRSAMEARGIRFVSPPRKAINQMRDLYFTVESFSYNEEEDIFICPAGSTLKFIGVVKNRPHQRCYAALRSVCWRCDLKDKCTRSSRRTLKVSINHAALIRLRADSKTESFKRLYRSRAPVIEGVFAEAKQWHGLGRAWRRGLSKMLVQSLLIATVLNFKRLATVFCPINVLFVALKYIISMILDDVRRFLCDIYKHEIFKTEIIYPI
jgi:transposase